jgi:AbrB family looped-hinge helix DNA binding protein
MGLVSRENQVTIPADVIRDAGLKPGDDVQIYAVGPGRIELVLSEALIDEFAGSLDSSVYTPGYLPESRNEWT